MEKEHNQSPRNNITTNWEVDCDYDDDNDDGNLTDYISIYKYKRPEMELDYKPLSLRETTLDNFACVYSTRQVILSNGKFAETHLRQSPYFIL